MSWPTDVETHIFYTGEVWSAASANMLRQAILDLHRRTSPDWDGVLANAITMSTGYGSLTGPAGIGPAVALDIGSTGLALISWSALMGTDTAGNGAWMSLRLSGATTLASNDSWALNYTPGSPGVGAAFGVSMIFGGNPGLTTYESEYRVQAAPAIANFSHRRITGQTLGS